MAKTALAIVRQRFPDVTTVKDAPISILVKVTRQDQTKAKRMKHDECAMALACQRERHVDGVLVSLGTTYLIKGTTATRYITTAQVGREITSFDRSGVFAEGTYQLRRPGPSNSLGASRSAPRGPRKRSRGSRAPSHFTSGVREMLGAKD